ncbi:MAG: TenA family protein [Alphaproteobacteria bacterium]|nr:TenA family protein [Alphaproteobacteria bacterium]
MAETYKNFNPKVEKFSEYLKNYSGELWLEATNHKFTNELMNDTLKNDIFKKYIVQDYIFIESLVTLISKAIFLAPNMHSKVKWAAFIYAITSDENNYFIRSFDALNITKEEREETKLLPSINDFANLMLQISNSGSYAQILSIILAAEWIYYTWASRAKEPYPDRFYLSEWIILHNNIAFHKTVAWIKGELDTLALELSYIEQEEIAKLFLNLVRLEIAFFDACYG